MKKPSALSTPLIFALMATCGACSAAGRHPPPPPAADWTPRPHSFACQAFAQPDRRYGPLKSLGEIRMSEPGHRSISGGGFRFRVEYSNDRYESPALRTYIYWEATGKMIEQSLLYFDRLNNPVNQFGSQGFTGLHYVYAPDSAAELQYICSSP